LGQGDRFMLKIIKSPSKIEAVGKPPKSIEEFIGRVASQTTGVSIARMRSPSGWTEPGQTPEFDEYSIILRGQLRVETRDGVQDVPAGQAVIAPGGQWVRYSTPGPEGAEYIAVCIPGFTPGTVHRDS
jgi:mannose-6-phosphate isomerase-like protein (cupin superfamily)